MKLEKDLQVSHWLFLLPKVYPYQIDYFVILLLPILLNPVPPVFKLESSSLEAQAGDSVSVNYSVVNDPHSGEMHSHFLKKEGQEKILTDYEITENGIVFKKVSIEDNGTYIISCQNDAGEGSTSFILHVTSAKGEFSV